MTDHIRNAHELLRALVDHVPNIDDDDMSPLLCAETPHRKYMVTGLRTDQNGDLVITLEDVY